MLNNAFRRAPEENMLEASMAVRRHDDQIGRKFLRESADFIERRCARP